MYVDNVVIQASAFLIGHLCAVKTSASGGKKEIMKTIIENLKYVFLSCRYIQHDFAELIIYFMYL
jgi:hypothetical protein